MWVILEHASGSFSSLCFPFSTHITSSIYMLNPCKTFHQSNQHRKWHHHLLSDSQETLVSPTSSVLALFLVPSTTLLLFPMKETALSVSRAAPIAQCLVAVTPLHSLASSQVIHTFNNISCSHFLLILFICSKLIDYDSY